MRRPFVRTLLEAGIVLVLGLAVGLIANAADTRRGIALDKDHLSLHTATWSPANQNSAVASAPREGESVGAVGGDKQDKPFEFIDHAKALSIFQDASYQTGADIFIDARDDEHYTEGHIPGAYQLDHYRSERYLPDLVPICEAADRIVIYCNGGECEDSQLAAQDLMNQGVDVTRLLVYEAGIAHWRAQKLPIEVGERLSGEITTNGSDAEE